MASEKELKNAAASRKRIEFLASCADQFMQDFIKKAAEDDKLGAIIASARLAQLGAVLTAEYEVACNQLVDSATEKRVADQAAEAVVTMVNANAEACKALRGDEPSPAEKSSSN